jgi:hypothetical protein
VFAPEEDRFGAPRVAIISYELWQRQHGGSADVISMVLGLGAAAFAARILRSQLFGITPADPMTFVLVPVVLLAIAALACFLPAVRATRLDPTVALRAE